MAFERFVKSGQFILHFLRCRLDMNLGRPHRVRGVMRYGVQATDAAHPNVGKSLSSSHVNNPETKIGALVTKAVGMTLGKT